jgi:precorrin-6B methylase 2
MKGSWRLVLVVCSLALLLLLWVDQGSGQDDSSKQTTLKVLLPQGRARVDVNGETIKLRASKTKNRAIREFVAPALSDGKKDYEVSVSWLTNDYTRFQRTMKVAPKPGETVEVDLRKPDPKNPDRIEIRFVPTPQDVVERMCKLAKIGKDDIVFDLGCGDGRMVITAVADFKAKRGVGIDLYQERVDESKEYAKEKKVDDKIEFRKGDILDPIKDLSDASVVMMYMGDDVNLRLRPIFLKTLKPGSRIVSHRFEMGDWKPDKSETFDAEDGDQYTIHLWTIPKKK